MCRKLIYLTSFLLALGLVLTSVAKADPNLVGWWKLDENSGSIAYDSSDYDNDGTIIGNPQWVPGYRGSALDFDGDGDYIDCGPGESLEVGNNITVAFWVNLRTVALDWMTAVAKGEHSWRVSTVYTTRNFHFGINYWELPGTTSMNGKSLVPPNEWVHICATYDGAMMRLYYDGVLNNDAASTTGIGTNEVNVRIGTNPEAVDRYWDGLIDDVRIYNRALSDEEIEELIEPQYKATAPEPYHNATVDTTDVTLSWVSGDTADSHHVYLGEVFEDVNNRESNTDKGLIPDDGSGYGRYTPEGLEIGKTYYWAIDEVEAGGAPVHPGDVWCFSILAKTASDPVPADGAECIEPNTLLEWTSGAGAVSHHVYFGDNFEDVNKGTGDTDKGTVTEPNFLTGLLEFDTTYYWRIDEDDDANVYTGEVWSFTTATAEMGAIGQYYNNEDLDGEPALTRIDYGIDFPWGATTPVDSSGFSIRWTADIDPPFTETYTFITVSDTGVRLWIDGELLIDNWTGHASEEDMATVALVAGEKVSLVMEYHEDGGWGTISLSWQSPSIPREIIPACVFSLPSRATAPSPGDGATDVQREPTLSWTPGIYADTHDVYFGTDFNDVNDANMASDPNVDFINVDVNSYEPGILQLNTTYYWRVDEVNDAHSDRLWRGSIWSFTTGNYLIVDDMESYNDLLPSDPNSNRINYTWEDGFGHGTDEYPPKLCGNETGSLIGHAKEPMAEPNIVHGGGQSLPYYYVNDASGVNNCDQQINVYYSEAERTFDPAQDWTEEGMMALSLWFYGDPNNDVNTTEQMYVKVNGVKVPYDGDMNDIREPMWHEWNVALAEFTDVDPMNITSLVIGFGDEDNTTTQGGSGLVYFDDIRLYQPRCVPSRRQPVGDFDNDCDVDYNDVAGIAGDWLVGDYTADPLIAWYKLDDGIGSTTAADESANGNDGTLEGSPVWVEAGQIDGALQFDDGNDYVDLGTSTVFDPQDSFSITLWAYITDWTEEWGHAMISNRGEDDLGWQLRRHNTDSICFTTRGVDNDDMPSNTAPPPLNEWIHIAAVYNKANSTKHLYLNGVEDVVYDTTPGTTIAPATHNVLIGARANTDNDNRDEGSYFRGMLDDIRLYNVALSQAEIESIMVGGEVSISDYHAVQSPAELYSAEAQGSKVISFKDFAILAEMWLEEPQLWP